MNNVLHSEKIIINAPVEKVYAILSNITSWPEWRSDVKEVKLKGPVKKETSFDWKAKGFTIRSKLHTVKPNHSFAWTGRILWIRAVHKWELTPHTTNTNNKNEDKKNEVDNNDIDNKTKVIVKESLNGIGAGLLKTTLTMTMKKDLEELRIKAEKE